MNYSTTNKRPGLFSMLTNLVKQQIGERKLDSPLGYILLGLVALVLAFAIAKIDTLVGMLFIAGLLGGTLAFICLFNTKLGFYITVSLSFFAFYINRLISENIPVGLGIDGLIALTFIGIYFRKTVQRQKYWQHSKNPIAAVYFLFMVFLVVELFNPSMDSIPGWVFAFRKFLNFVMIFYISLHIFEDLATVKEFIKLWLVLAFLAGAYGCFQEWHGLLGFEDRWVNRDPIRYKLYFQAGSMRKFSFLSDPTAYGMLMADAVIFALVLSMGSVTRKQRMLLLGISIPMALGMAFSGTRTAYAMLPAGVIFYVLMTITSKKTMAFAILSMMVFIVVLFGPFHNGTISRIRTTFLLSEDGSFNVRDVNRERIQPYILRHPLGGGLSTSGVVGSQYNPGHTLAGFPPDSGYLKSALETGWVGLFLTCFTYFVILRTGIRNFYKSQSPEIKGIYAAILAALYGYIVAHYTQVAIGQIPGCFFFYSMLAALVKLITFEKEQPNKKNLITVKL
ncbi:O-antigen ligase family protein [Chitinophaga defluvii]|uniref:O-antigen ligase family protein n=1 Tax=Chitinophaga defluvii TaxID=3163343 RepID=A0ABV2T2Z3_9BACT